MVIASGLKPYAVAKRPIGLGWSIAIALAVCFVSVRALEVSDDPVALSRVALSALSIGMFFAVRRYSLIRGLLLALAIEVVSGTALFVFVDLPMVDRLGPQIGRTAVMILERNEPHAFHALAMLVHR